MAEERLVVAVVEDQALLRILTVERLGEHLGDEAAVAGYAGVAEILLLERAPDVVLLDLQLEGSTLQGPAAVRALVASGITVVVLSGLHTAEALSEAMAAGARGFLTKDLTEIAEIADGLRRVLAGEQYVHPLLRERIADADRRGLTPRQREVLRLEALGRTLTQIAREMGLKERGVRNHIEGIVEVYPECAKQADRVRLASRLGLVSPWEAYTKPAGGGRG